MDACHARWRRDHRAAGQLGLAIHANVQLHTETPLLTLAGQMHFGVSVLVGVLGEAGRANDGGVGQPYRSTAAPACLCSQGADAVHAPAGLTKSKKGAISCCTLPRLQCGSSEAPAVGLFCGWCCQ